MERIPRVLIGLVVPALVLPWAGCSMRSPHSVCIGLDQVFYLLRGEGDPTIVLESGIGDGYRSWSPALDGIAAISTTFAYSRPGYTADSYHHHRTNGRRTAGEIVSLLREVLRDLDLKPPYVLVGHSAGGTYMLHFAARYPDEVAGIVLVDARLPGFRDECIAAGLDFCRPPGTWAGRAPDHVLEELRGLRESEAEVSPPRELGSIPVTVIAAERPPPHASEERQALWLDVQRRFAADAAEGRFVAADGCGHYVQHDDPELVIHEIESLVERSRTRPEPAAQRDDVTVRTASRRRAAPRSPAGSSPLAAAR